MKPRARFKSLMFLAVFAALLMAYGTAAANASDQERQILCADGRAPIGDLGITGMAMKGSMYMNTDANEHWWHFETEPKINKIDPDGPSAGILKPGDIIVAIDGLAITTRKAGKRFGNLPAGEPVEITVRRGGRRLDFEITPRAVCLEDHPLHVEIPEPPDISITADRLEMLSKKLEAISLIEIPDLPDVPYIENFPELTIQPKAWFGMGISCSDCTIKAGRDGEAARWQFSTPPEIESVDPGGPADQAGLRKGDILTHVDGIRLDTRKGGQRFSSIEPGETVTWKIKRGTQHETVEMYALERPERLVQRAPRHIIVHEDAPVRFTGVLGGTDIEVRGKSSIQVTEDESEGVIIITTRDGVIRLKRVEKDD